MSSNMLVKHKAILADMLYLDTWRGRDSTGVAAIRHNADTDILKSTVPGYEFVEGNKLEVFLRLNDFLWIGHNRFGTMGKNIKSNAHPFSIEDEQGGSLVVGAHNGTLKNKYELEGHMQFGTDSEALYHNIAHRGLKNTIEKVDGAWALTYYDHVLEEFRVLRNKERPLCYAFEKGKKTLFWASESWMIRIATSRNGIELEGDIKSFDEDTLYCIPAPMKMNEVLEMERKEGMVGKQPAPFFHQTDRKWCGGRLVGGETHAETKKEAPSTSQSPTVKDTESGTKKDSAGDILTLTKPPSSENSQPVKSDKVVPIKSVKMYRGYGGKLVRETDIVFDLADGCHWCDYEELTPETKGYGWLAPHIPVCPKCLLGEHEDKDVIEEMSKKTATVH